MAIELETEDLLPPLHPGEVLREDFMVPLGLTAYAVAKACGVPRTRIERIVREETPVTADTALRLGRYFGMDPQIWINLQGDHDLRCAQRRIGAEVDRIRPLPRKAA
ncbi:HigA family addiction module antidote protein [Methylobacterium terricola]|uniref:HigA family addiction module antidote protein n=1 Tax=Methylobacterium terricola TaxID=2583531 RepID=A0A5C4LHR9_9HYPH|nr:HigA family addiction module antitoxin [Methylobacterium terricola]TNC12341.1 HigA family addiction module antidote protein [Methylobacterium terricola]